MVLRAYSSSEVPVETYVFVNTTPPGREPSEA